MKPWDIPRKCNILLRSLDAMILPTVIEAIETTTITVWNDGDKSAFTTVNNLNNVAIETTLASVLIKAVVKAGEPS
jgi:hypothetical protein